MFVSLSNEGVGWTVGENPSPVLSGQEQGKGQVTRRHSGEGSILPVRVNLRRHGPFRVTVTVDVM